MKTTKPTLKLPLPRIASIFFGMLTFLLFLNCDRPSADKPNSKKFTLIGKYQFHYQIDVGEEGHSHGDIKVFEGSLMDKKKENIVGRYTGKLDFLSLPQKNGSPDQVHEDRFRTIVFEFDDGSTIVIKGLSHYSFGESFMDIDDPRDAAIIGGTGIYIGARGQVSTTRITDIHYEYKFEILP